MSTVAVALIVAVIAPSVLAFLQNRLARGDKREDYARLDLVAARAEEAARLVGVRQDAAATQARDAARLLVRATAAAAETAATATGALTTKLDVIHGLVNSQMTAAMRSELDATIRELAMMREVVALHQAAGREPTATSLAAIASTETKIEELTEQLAERDRQDRIAGAAVDNPPREGH